jgi:hypothetical protein
MDCLLINLVGSWMSLYGEIDFMMYVDGIFNKEIFIKIFIDFLQLTLGVFFPLYIHPQKNLARIFISVDAQKYTINEL